MAINDEMAKYNDELLTFAEVMEVYINAWKHLKRNNDVCHGCKFDKEWCSDYDCYCYNIFLVCFEDYLKKRSESEG